MAWQDRIREAAYTSPRGIRTVLNYEDVQLRVEKKTTGFEFPSVDGTYVQESGHTGKRVPLRVFFWGDDYDVVSEGFLSSLLERGQGKLEHPVYGVLDVVPFGAISRRDDLKTAANQAVFEVTFWETINLTFGKDDPASLVLSSVDDFNGALAEQFDESLDLSSASLLDLFKNEYLNLLAGAEKGLQGTQEFDVISTSINESIDVLIADPLTLAFQTMLLIQTPAYVLSNIKARLLAYKNLASDIYESGTATKNTFLEKDLYALSYLSASVISVINAEFATKTEALDAAVSILDQLNEITNWRDDSFAQFGEIDTGEAYQQIQQSASLAAGFLVEISFSLKQERKIILDRARTIIDLSAELYGQVDEQLDFLIVSNNLSGSEILELPRGREIVYYI